MRAEGHAKLLLRQETPSDSAGEPSQKTTNYKGEIPGFSNENFGLIVMGGFALFLIFIIRRAFKR